jgi:hypothetical protein
VPRALLDVDDRQRLIVPARTAKNCHKFPSLPVAFLLPSVRVAGNIGDYIASSRRLSLYSIYSLQLSVSAGTTESQEKLRSGRTQYNHNLTWPAGGDGQRNAASARV